MLPSAQEIIGFIEVATTSNITKAASKLGITQPSLSQSLKKLEHSIGEKLLIRSKNGVQLTLAGKTFYKHAKHLLDNWEKAKAETQNSNLEVKGNIKMGCHPSVGLYSLDLFLPELLNNHTGLEISLSHDLSRKIAQKVIDYELDLGLVINPIKHPDLMMVKLLEDEVRVWHLPKKKPDVLICHPELVQTQDILKKLRKKKESFKRIVTTNSLEIITKLVLKGAGHGVIPGRVVASLNGGKKITPMKGGPLFKDELYLIYRVENKNIESIKTIKEHVKNSLKN